MDTLLTTLIRSCLNSLTQFSIDYEITSSESCKLLHRSNKIGKLWLFSQDGLVYPELSLNSKSPVSSKILYTRLIESSRELNIKLLIRKDFISDIDTSNYSEVGKYVLIV